MGGARGRFLFFLFLFCITNSFAIAEYKIGIPIGKLGRDLSAAFDSEEQKLEPVANLNASGIIQALSKYKILLVPGFLYDYLEEFNGNMQALTNWLRAHGIQYESMHRKYGFDSEAGPEENAIAILQAIQATDAPIILVSHSKGSIDVLYALLGDTDARAKVKGWISLQSPIWGSPVADTVTDSWDAGPMDILLDLSGGSSKSLWSLRQDVRKQYIQEHLVEILGLNAQFPILSFATWKLYPDMAWHLRRVNLLYGSKLFAEAYNANDGLVPINNALIPYSNYIVAKGLDHSDLTIDKPGRLDRNRTVIFGALLKLLLSLPSFR